MLKVSATLPLHDLTVELPWVDMKVANMLCVGGACKYNLNEDTGINNAFIFQYILPGVLSQLPIDVCLVLGTV